MHIILGVLGTVVTILVLLNRLSENGIDIGWLNPFSWYRRRTYRVNHDLNPAFILPGALDSVALLLVTITKADGDMSKEQKTRLLQIFEDKFHLGRKQAIELLGASVHLFGRGDEVLANPQRILDRSIGAFSSEQVQSLAELMTEVAQIEGESSAAQQRVINKVMVRLPKVEKGQWQ